MLDELIRQCQVGDQKAFVELFRIHGSMIQKIAFKITRRQEWQRDIYHDVVTRVIENIKSFRGNCKFTTWLYRISVNCAFAMISKEIPYQKMSHAETSDAYPVEKLPDAQNIFEQRERFSRILYVIRRFNDDNRTVMAMFYFGELSVEEIAIATGKSNGAVKAVLWKGRRTIVKELKKQGVFNLL